MVRGCVYCDNYIYFFELKYSLSTRNCCFKIRLNNPFPISPVPFETADRKISPLGRVFWYNLSLPVCRTITQPSRRKKFSRSLQLGMEHPCNCIRIVLKQDTQHIRCMFTTVGGIVVLGIIIFIIDRILDQMSCQFVSKLL